MGMSGEIDHADIVSTDIEEVHNLVKLANYLKVKLSLEIGKFFQRFFHLLLVLLLPLYDSLN